MQDPKKTLEKLTKYAKNPQFADHSEKMEQTEHLANIAENIKPLSKVGSFVQHFLDEVTPKKGTDYLTDEEMEQIKKEAKGEVGEKGTDGKTPEFGKDYFTPEHIEQIKQGIKEEVTPVKDVDYRDGVDGKDGQDGLDADENRIIESVLAKIPTPKDGVSPKIEDIVKTTIQHLGSLKGNDRPSLKMFRESDDLIGTVSLHKNMMSRMPKSLIDGEQMWGGHGVVLNAGSNVTITQNTDGSYTIGSTGGSGFTILNTLSTVNGSNTSFVFLTATAQPSLVISDGIQLTQKDNLGNNQWTWNNGTKTVTMVNPPPASSIFAIQ